MLKNELATEIGTTPSAVGQFEQGRIRPTPETLLRISLVLGVPPDFFTGTAPTVVPSEACHFRRLRSSTQQEQRRVRAEGALILSVIEHLDTLVDLPAETLSTFSSALQGTEDVAQLAERVRSEWRLGAGPIASMVGLLEREGVIVVQAAGHSERLDAFSAWVGKRPLIFLATEKGSASRRRFDAAHELAHLLMHTDVSPGALAVERQADAFASALLLPEEAFVAECPRRLAWERLLEMKQRWKVSLAALVRRAYDLGIYSEATYRRAYVQLSEKGWRQQEPAEPEMEHPQTVQRAIALLEGSGYTRTQIAQAVRLYPEDLLRLLGSSASAAAHPVADAGVTGAFLHTSDPPSADAVRKL
jgi:Zn-dependent peptidase ImmA (M78 family)/DNA-binding XRE family transcriptional regulator